MHVSCSAQIMNAQQFERTIIQKTIVSRLSDGLELLLLGQMWLQPGPTALRLNELLCEGCIISSCIIFSLAQIMLLLLYQTHHMTHGFRRE